MINSFPEIPPFPSRLNRLERDRVAITSDFEDETGQHPTIEVDKNPTGLFLFDLDGTLIDAKKIHVPATMAVYKETLGEKFRLPFEDPAFLDHFRDAYISHWGLGVGEVFESLCSDLDISFDSEEEKERILTEMVSKYSSAVTSLVRESSQEQRSAMILPGVIPFLEEMKQRGIPAALVTGNNALPAHSFIKYLGLSKYFVTGGFDDDPEVVDEPYRRSSILTSALEKCKAKGIVLPGNVAIFGDTAKDFQTIRYDMQGMKPHIFLVATGTTNLHDLSNLKDEKTGARPHLVMSSFSGMKIKEFFDDIEKYPRRDD